jgi:hypothetical protein
MQIDIHKTAQERSGSVDLNSLTLIDKCDWGGFVKVQSCPAAAVVVNV